MEIFSLFKSALNVSERKIASKKAKMQKSLGKITVMMS